MKIVLFDKLVIEITDEDWNFFCEYRFGTHQPTEEMIQSEFVSGTGIHINKKDKWSVASKEFSEYIADLKEIQRLDVNQAAKNLIIEEDGCKSGIIP